MGGRVPWGLRGRTYGGAGRAATAAPAARAAPRRPALPDGARLPPHARRRLVLEAPGAAWPAGAGALAAVAEA